MGANVGNRTKIALKLGAVVVAVEPQAECVRVLKACYARNKRLIVVPMALGPSVGDAEILISNANTLSTLSRDWVESVKRSGRFHGYEWNKKQIVKMTTLDQLILQYGKPAFIKIDVEGFEYEVLRGLTQPVKSLSLEFTPECLSSTFKCITYLHELGNNFFNYAVGESMELVLSEWAKAKDMLGILSRYVTTNSHQFGDVYVKFQM